MDSVITSNTYVFNLQKSNFYFKVVLSSIQNPDETKEKRRDVQFDCWAGEEGHRPTCACDSHALTCLHLGQQAGSRREGEAEANVPRL